MIASHATTAPMISGELAARDADRAGREPTTCRRPRSFPPRRPLRRSARHLQLQPELMQPVRNVVHRQSGIRPLDDRLGIQLDVSCPSSSDNTNQLVAAQCPVLQNEIVGWSVSTPVLCDALDVFGGQSLASFVNQTSWLTFFAPTIVPGVLAAACRVSPAKNAAGRASSSCAERLPTACATSSRVAIRRGSSVTSKLTGRGEFRSFSRHRQTCRTPRCHTAV